SQTLILSKEENMVEKSQQLEFHSTPGLTDVRIAKIITTPKGESVRVVATGSTTIITNPQKPGQTIILTGSGTADLSIGGVVDAIGDALVGLLKLLAKSCTPTTTVTQNFKDGQLVGQTITTACVPN
ncbi:MAG: hypothetical protein WBF42_16245, partial [Terracidiphilus sp.]